MRRKRNICRTILGCLLLSLPSISYSQGFLHAIPDAQAGLTGEQQNKLNLLRENPTYESIIMVQVGDLPTLQHDGELMINIPGKPARNAIAYRIENPTQSKTGDFTWEGAFFIDTTVDGANHDTTGDGNIILYRKNGEIYGSIELPFDDDVFELASFAPGKNALIKYNSTNLRNSNCGIPDAGDTPDPVEKVTGPCSGKVKVMVAYTAAAAAAVPNITNTINQAIGNLNGAINNSAGSTQDLSFELIGAYQTSFNEYHGGSANDFSINLYNIESATSFHLDRYNYGADLVIVMTDGNYQGSSNGSTFNITGHAEIGPGKELAYAYVEADHANTNYAFAHEVGHLMGARHQQSWISPINYDDTPGEPHGYKMKRHPLFSSATTYITIMDNDLNLTKSHMYSTPDVQIWSKDMGKAGENNNTNVVLGNACTVASYFPDGGVSFTAAIKANKVLTPTGSVVTLTGTTNEMGTMPYTYTWAVSDDGFTWSSLSSTTNIANYTMPDKRRIYVMFDAYDVYGINATAMRTLNNSYYRIFDPHYFSEPQIFIPAGELNRLTINADNASWLYPNPATNKITVNLVGDEVVTDYVLRMFSADGAIVYSAPVKDTKFDINVDKFARGLYFVELSGGKENKVSKVILK